ncbi:MAG: biotin/lipoyl-binding protein, partial [Prevotellaceae bacterium]|nr:biotin/lipoyl-binding protein [Prevotellaceae bacterium]
MVILLSSCKNKESKITDEYYPQMTVNYSNKSLFLRYPATIRGKSDIAIFPQVSGYITEVKVEEGAIVHKGQTLFIIDQIPFKADLQTATANISLSKSNVATAQLNFDSKQELFNKNVVSSFELQTAQNALAIAKAQLEQAEAQEVV